MAKQLLCVAILIVLRYAVVHTQTINFHHIGIEEGLSNTHNESCYKDTKGFVWISSVSGLNRFDGQEVRVYRPNPLDSNAILGENMQGNFYEDTNSNIWFATFEGINCYDRKSDQFRHFFLRDSSGQAKPSYYCTGLDGQQNLWVIHNSTQLYLFNTQTRTFTFQHILQDDTQRGCLAFDSDGSVHSYATHSLNQSGVHLFFYKKGHLVRQVSLFEDHQGDQPILLIKKIVIEKDSLAWLATSQGLVSLDLNTLSNKVFPMSRQVVNSIAIHPKGGIWCAIKDHGLYHFDTHKNELDRQCLHSFDDPRTLRTNNINFLSADREGGIWASILGKGVDFGVPQKTKFKILMPPNVSENTTYEALLEARDGYIWCVSAKNGIVLLDSKQNKVAQYNSIAKHPFALPNNNIYHLFEDLQGRIWVMSQGGLWLLSNKKKGLEIIDGQHGYLYGIQTHDGRLLFSTYDGGVTEWIEKRTGVFLSKTVSGIDPSKPYTMLFEDTKRRLWVGKQLEFINIFEKKDTGYQLLAERAFAGVPSSIWEDVQRRQVWFASSTGLARVDDTNFEIEILNEKTGLPNSTVYGLLADDLGQHLWVSTGKGIARIELDTRRIKNYTLSDGLSDLEFGWLSFLKRRNGEFWFGSGQGITVFRPDQIKPLDIVAHPHITRLEINDALAQHLSCKQTGVTNINEIRELHFDYQDNTLSFSLSSLEYSDPDHTKVRYLLVGVDHDTLMATSGIVARYPDLRSGRYTLLVWAANSDGVWNPIPHQLIIVIATPWWQTWWFYTLSALFVFGIIGFVTAFYYRYQLRTKMLISEKKQREAEKKQLQLQQELALRDQRDQISQGIHDDLGAGLSSIRIVSERMLKKFETDAAKEALRRISSTATELDDNRRSLSWATDPEMDSVASLVARLRRESNAIFEGTDIDFHTDIPIDLNDAPMSGAKRLHLLRATKEGLNNALRHANASTISLSVKVTADQINIIIRNDGKNFDALAEKGKGKGLSGIDKHLNAIDGTAEWMPNPDGGTILILHAPLGIVS